ncbi:MAG: transglycosylase SLT domain-containing protein [Acidimicrobiales bacterium]
MATTRDGAGARRRRTGTILAVALIVSACTGSDDVADDGGGEPRAVATVTSTTTSSSTATTATGSDQTDEPPVELYPGQPVRPPHLPGDPVELAAVLVEAERTVRDPDAPADVVAEMAHVQQYAYRVLADAPEWDDTVRAALPEDLRGAFDANVGARRELRGMHTHLLETLPAWRIVAPEPHDVLLGHYRDAEAIHGAPWEHLAAIHLVETAIGRVDGVSVAGALGPMQFMPGTWDAFGEGDVHDSRDAIMAAARYLDHSGAPDDMTAALFAYNRHHNYVRAIEHYASVMRDDPNAYAGYYHWQVYVLTVEGDVVMPVGFDESERVPVQEHLARLGS